MENDTHEQTSKDPLPLGLVAQFSRSLRQSDDRSGNYGWKRE